MGMTKNYLLKLQESCSEHVFGQDAIEWAIMSGWVKLTYNLADDIRAIMGENGSNYDQIIIAYRKRINELSLHPLFDAILRDHLQPITTINETTNISVQAGERRTVAEIAPEVGRMELRTEVQRMEDVSPRSERPVLQPQE